jgi:O-antigen/teichoic acid export membrane protein
MFLATGVTGLVNILFRVVMGRMLTVEEFGEFNSIFALAFYASHILTRTIRISTTDFVSQRSGEGDTAIQTEDLKRYVRPTAVAAVVTSVVFVLFSSPIKGFLKLDSIWLVLTAVPFIAISWVLPVNLGIFQGRQRFLPLAATTLMQSITKLVFGVLLVSLGLGAIGAMNGVWLGALAAFLFSLVILFVYFIKVRGQDVEGPSDGVGRTSSREVMSVSGHVLMAIICLAILTNIDVLLVKHFYTSEETGLYSAALVFGRIIYFLPVGFVTVMYPKMVESHAKGGDTFNTLKRGLAYICIPVLALTVLLNLDPSFFLRLVMGSQYLGSEDLVGLYALLMLIFSTITVLVFYFLAVRMYHAVYAFAGLSVLQVAVVWFHHPDLETIIWIFIWVNLVMLMVSGAFVALSSGSNRGRGKVDG